MGAKSSIEWTDASWNPVRARLKQAREVPSPSSPNGLKLLPKGTWGYHCERISPGCKRCYACTGNGRTLPAWGTGLDYAVPNREKVEIFLDEEELMRPLHWKRPRMIFACSMTDWCAEFVTDEMRDRMMAVAALCPQHTFQFLTKRAEGMREYLDAPGMPDRIDASICAMEIDSRADFQWPLPNVWLGVSVEDRARLDRIEHLRQTPAAVRFLSLEPLLEDLGDISRYLRTTDEESLECPECSWLGREEDARRVDKPAEDWWFACPKCGETCAHTPIDELGPGIDWVIVGGESGPGARPCDIEAVRSIIAQCKAAGVPVFFKQAGAKPFIRYQTDYPAWPKGATFTILSMNEPQIYPRKLVGLKDRKGGNPAEWAPDLRVRQIQGGAK